MCRRWCGFCWWRAFVCECAIELCYFLQSNTGSMEIRIVLIEKGFWITPVNDSAISCNLRFSYAFLQLGLLKPEMTTDTKRISQWTWYILYNRSVKNWMTMTLMTMFIDGIGHYIMNNVVNSFALTISLFERRNSQMNMVKHCWTFWRQNFLGKL